MVVAMGAVRVVEVPSHEVVDVIAVGDRFVAATVAVDVVARVARTEVRGGAGGGIGGVHFENTFVYMAVVAVVEVPIVEVVDVVAMADRDMAAVGAVDMIVIGVGAVAHGCFFFP